MSLDSQQPRLYWSSMTTYLLVTTGAVVGLGNILHFPFYVHQLGGLFVLLYVLCELLISIPILLAELVIGRRGKQNPVGSFEILSMEADASLAWRWAGWLCFIVVFLSLAVYTVAVTFPLAYFSDIFSKIFTNVSLTAHPHDIQSMNPFVILEICLLSFLLATLIVIARGIHRGLETISCITVPLYFIILLGLAIYSCSVGHVHQAINEMFDMHPHASFITIFFTALTYAFFKLNVGMGSMIVYGSYLPYSVSFGRSTFLIVCFDAIISLLSYFVIYPLYIPAHVIQPAIQTYQESLFFFSHIKNGNIVALLFYFAAVVAAWTPTIAMAETATVTLVQRFALSRKTATLIVFLGAGIIGTLIILFQQFPPIKLIDHITSNLLIPISALLTAIFAGWILSQRTTRNELGFNPIVYKIWRFLVRFVAPVCIVITALMLM